VIVMLPHDTALQQSYLANMWQHNGALPLVVHSTECHCMLLVACCWLLAARASPAAPEEFKEVAGAVCSPRCTAH